jgi:hypothetical protein
MRILANESGMLRCEFCLARIVIVTSSGFYMSSFSPSSQGQQWLCHDGQAKIAKLFARKNRVLS